MGIYTRKHLKQQHDESLNPVPLELYKRIAEMAFNDKEIKSAKRAIVACLKAGNMRADGRYSGVKLHAAEIVLGHQISVAKVQKPESHTNNAVQVQVYVPEAKGLIKRRELNINATDV